MKISTLQKKTAFYAAFVTLMLLVTGLSQAMAQTFTQGNLNYSINNDGATVTVTGFADGYNEEGELVIPESVELYGTSYSVTAIGESAFSYRQGITNLVLSNALVEIGNNAFEGCYNLTGSLTIPKNVSRIGYGAFDYCYGFTTLIYNSEKSLSFPCCTHWLAGCYSLSSLIIGENVKYIPSRFLEGCSSFTGELVIPESVTSIGSDAFSGCTGFTGSLNIPNSVVTIGTGAFNGCTGFDGSLNLGGSVTTIAENAFNGCASLTGSLTIPNSVTSIGVNAFSGCTGFSGTLTIGFSVTQIGNTALFGACENFTSINLLTETPPTLGNNVFISADYSIPVYVPCGSLDSYQNAEGWSVFTNIQEQNPCHWEITVVTSPDFGGNVTGAGVWEQGQTCTLVALPNESFAFLNWTENDEVVSTDASYSFEVTGNRTLKAHFYIPTFIVNATSNPIGGGSTGAKTFDFTRIPTGWSYNTNYPWQLTNSSPQSGSYSLKSGNTGVNNSTSFIETTFNFQNDGSIEFYSRISSESSYDKGHFYIDGAEMLTESGSVDWTSHSYDVAAGNHTFRWSYSKDSSDHVGEDGYFIGHVTFIGADGGGEFMGGETCTLTATPSSDDYLFVNWTENGQVVSSDAQYSFTVTDNRNLVANFVKIRFDVTASANPEEGGTVTGGGNFMLNQTCTLTATPGDEYEFVNWTENGQVVSTNATYSFLVSTDRNLVANFAIPSFNITASANPTVGGTVSFQENHTTFDFENNSLQGWTSIDADGDGYNWSITINGASHSGNHLVSSWSYLNNGALNPDNYLVSPELQNAVSIDYYVAGDKQYRDHYGLYASTSGNNIGDFSLVFEETIQASKSMTPWHERTLALPQGTKYVAFRHYDSYDKYYLYIDDITIHTTTTSFAYQKGSTCTLTATPINGYQFDNWKENGNVVSTEAEYSFTVTGERTLVANFSLVPFTITVAPNFSDRGSVSGGGDYTVGSTCTVTATPNTGHNFVRWVENGQEVSTDATYSFTVDGARDLVAVFTAHVDDIITFADANVKNICISNWDADGDSELTYDEAANVTNLDYAFNYYHSITTFNELQYFTGLTYLNSHEFNECTNLSSIILPANLTTIDYSAFRNCFSLHGEFTIPEAVDYIGGYAFYGCDEITTINYNAANCSEVGSSGEPAFFDCASLAHLHIGENVVNIPNYAFKRCSSIEDMTVAATVPPTIYASTFATVSRSIPVTVPFGSGEAYRNAPYWNEFFNITEGIPTVTYPNHWHPNNHQFAFNMSVIGIVQINGVEQANPALEVGAFCGNECRGSKLLTYYPQIDRYVLFLTLFGETNDQFTFRLYDHEQAEESLLACDEVITFAQNNVAGTYQNPEIFNFISIQNTALSQGWNWHSSYVELGANSLDMMTGSMGESGLMIKSQSDGFTSYEDGQWFGSLTAVNNENTYLINTSADCIMSVTGDFVDPAQHPIAIANGWSWIGYPSTHAVGVGTALASFAAHDGDMIKSQDLFSVYASGEGWFGSLYTLNPGMGLMYRSTNSQSATLVFADGAKGAVENISSSNNHWAPNRQAYPHNMNVMAVVRLEGKELADSNMELAAFDGDECRGSARLLYIEHLNRYIAFLTVTGDEDAELTWKLYDATTGTVYDYADSHLGFEANGVVGSLDNPFVVDFSALTSADETLASAVRIYPNPVKANDKIRVNLPIVAKARLEVVNPLGTVVAAETVTGAINSIKAPATPGVYVLKVAIDGKGTFTSKLIVE